MINNNFSAWEKIKPALVERAINIAGFSVAHDCYNNVIIEKLSDKLGDAIVFEIVSELGVEVYDESNDGCEIAYSSNNFILCKNGLSYLINPYNSTMLRQVHMHAKELKIRIKKIGIISRINTSKALGEEQGTDENFFSSSTIHTLLELIIVQSFERGVTDIHIYPRNEKYVFIKFRINGQLVESNIDDVRFIDYKLLANVLLNLAKKNPGVYSTFQEAKFDYSCTIGSLSVRLQMNPTIYSFKEDGKVCPSFILRTHKADSVSFRSIESLGFFKEHEQILKRSAKQNQGLILVSGPTNSGKTTALYGILAETTLNKDICVQTVEDPVEVELPGIKQLNINEESGVSYVSALKSILRSDVDVALIGEIRDPITAQKSIELDKTGHLVLSTLHTKTSLAIIDRLRQFGVSDTDISDSLSVLISTRLLPRVCQHCSTTIPIKDNESIMEKFQYKAQDLEFKIKVRHPKGCKHCDIGYSGRVMVAEVFFMDFTIRAMIAKGIGQRDIYAHITQKNKNKTIWDHGFELLMQGLITFESMEQLLPTYIDDDDFTPEGYTKV
jgi:type II secretory ATPase GspE/PulE/Tfp pilus assembly ATPase PilB-like protein